MNGYFYSKTALKDKSNKIRKGNKISPKAGSARGNWGARGLLSPTSLNISPTPPVGCLSRNRASGNPLAVSIGAKQEYTGGGIR